MLLRSTAKQTPEYGGDGGKTAGVCADRRGPVATFPGHWAPNDLAIYHGTQFPAGYRSGAFIAFHGSWNRAPLPQQGYNVVFQPLADGKASGPFVVFADGFAGADRDPGKAAFRPTGLAEGPDGALYVTDDVHGRIWRITYNGDGSWPQRRRRQLWPQTTHPRPSRPKANILMRVDLPASFRCRPGPPPSKWHWEIGYFMARRATAPAAAVTGLMLAEARKGHPSTAAIGFGATEAWPH
jgi:hypothetical protein